MGSLQVIHPSSGGKHRSGLAAATSSTLKERKGEAHFARQMQSQEQGCAGREKDALSLGYLQLSSNISRAKTTGSAFIQFTHLNRHVNRK